MYDRSVYVCFVLWTASNQLTDGELLPLEMTTTNEAPSLREIITMAYRRYVHLSRHSPLIFLPHWVKGLSFCG